MEYNTGHGHAKEHDVVIRCAEFRWGNFAFGGWVVECQDW